LIACASILRRVALEEYKKKRNFSKTPEPGGAEPSAHAPGNSFVIQKHAATRLHYDFRLELDGVLLSASQSTSKIIRSNIPTSKA
jgi:DNA ligase D-like protein (predicted 3'-phosphoesterase)